MKKEFNIGDKVILKDDLVIDKAYDGMSFLDGMAELKGQTLTIADVDTDGTCKVEESGFWFACEMLRHNTDKLIFKGKETILIKDGKKYVSKCADGDTYDKEKGLLLCLAKANGVSYEDLQKMIDGAEDKNKEAAERFIKDLVERAKVFLEAGFKALRDKDNANTKPEADKKEAEKTVKEVKRRAEVGEYIKIIKACFAAGRYENGDVLKVTNLSKTTDNVFVEGVFCETCIMPCEYVVLENYNPYKITLSEFWKSKDKLAVHCKTEDEAKELCKAFDKAGKKWRCGEKYDSFTNWGWNKERTLYYNRNSYGNINLAENTIIYEFNDVDLNN